MLSHEQEEVIGGFNMFPANTEEISEEDFWHAFLMSPGSGTWVSRQANRDAEGNKFDRVRNLKLWVTNLQSRAPEGYIIEEHVVRAKAQPLAFYKFWTCDHDYHGYSTIRGWHDYKCSKCGQRQVWDSSD